MILVLTGCNASRITPSRNYYRHSVRYYPKRYYKPIYIYNDTKYKRTIKGSKVSTRINNRSRNYTNRSTKSKINRNSVTSGNRRNIR